MNQEQLLKEHTIREKAVINFFNEAVREFQVSFLATGCERFIGVRIQTIIAFTFVEVLSSFWDCYINKQRGPDARIQEWFNTFCELDKNVIYKNNPYFKNLGVKPLIDLRHSLIHFFGMSPQKIGKQITLCSSDIDDETFEKFKNKFTKNIAVLKPIDFYQLFKEGGLLMIQKILENVEVSKINENKKQDHIKGINRIFQKFQTEGAMQILIPKLNK